MSILIDMKFDDFWQKMYRSLRTQRNFTTLHRRSPFSAYSENNSIVVVPKTKDPRNLTRAQFMEIWNNASKLPSYERYRPGNYSKITFNSSYAVTLMKAFL